MTTSTRFAVAVHVLTLLAQSRGEPLTSEYVAGSVNTHPAVVRRLLMALARAGLTTTQFGAGGGALLARDPAAITLLDVYRAVEESSPFALHRERPNPDCRVGRNIQATLSTRMTRATRALEDELSKDTIADMLADVARRDRSARRTADSAG